MTYVDEIYGEHELDGVLAELIETNVLQRLTGIHQGGALFLVNPRIDHTRFEHSIGVMLLMRQVGATLEAQIAGLLHDISHTAFSHLIDYVFELEEEDYHEERYVEVLESPEIVKVLENNGFHVDRFKGLERFRILENPLPNLSADRIDYTLRDLFQIDQVSLEDIRWFMQGLTVADGRLLVKGIEYGEWFQSNYRFLTSQYFGSTENVEVHLAMKHLLKDALQEGRIEEADFFKDDAYVINKLGGEKVLKRWIATHTRVQTESVKMKERAVDPEIILNDQIIRLSDVSSQQRR